MPGMGKAIEILLVEDNPGDAELTRVALSEGRFANNLRVVTDGDQALQYLRSEGDFVGAALPDLILLDLNLPKLDGREVLSAIKKDDRLKVIPVVVLTTSHAETDILDVYNMNANCYICKPVDLDQFLNVVKVIEDFWFTIVKLPPV